jgi:hypothetical protein
MKKSLILISLLMISGGSAVTGWAQNMTLDYIAHYRCQSGEPDHLLEVISAGDSRAVVAGNMGIALIDLDSLPPQGSQAYIDRLSGPNTRNLYLKDDNYIFANLNRTDNTSYGFQVVGLSSNSLRDITTIVESGVFYEKMCIDGDYLFIAAHNDGIRIFDISDPENPAPVGRIDDGFVDAWAICTVGDTACVADGGGGLKIIDVTDKNNPYIITGETLETAVGTAEDVVYRDGIVYMAIGKNGLAVYPSGNLQNRIIYELGMLVKDLCWADEYLVAADVGGFSVLDVGDPYNIQIVASEKSARRGEDAALRLCMAVAYAGNNRILAADWHYMDVYELKAPGSGTQPDINITNQRIRFSPGGGTETVSLYNAGQTDLEINSVQSTNPAFSANYSGGTIAPGDTVSFDISYNGSQNGTGLIRIYSDDPDENPLAIQVFGNTDYLDPGEPAVDFTMPCLRKDPQTGNYIEESFTLSEHFGKPIWFRVYTSW